MNMREESKKFPAVMTIKEVLGLEEGTWLRFDWASGKYVSITEEEDIADDYYYSGYAVAIDPYLVKDNIGTYFVHVEQEGEPEKEVETELTVSATDDSYKPIVEIHTEGEDKVEINTTEAPEEYKKIHALVMDCKCGERGLLGTIQAPGINITIMAEDPDSFVKLICPRCDSEMTLHFDQSGEEIRTITDEPAKEESN